MTQNTVPLPEPATVTVLHEVAYYTADQMHAHAAKVCAEKDAEIDRLNTVIKSWLRANGPDGWIDDMRVELAALKETK